MFLALLLAFTITNCPELRLRCAKTAVGQTTPIWCENGLLEEWCPKGAGIVDDSQGAEVVGELKLEPIQAPPPTTLPLPPIAPESLPEGKKGPEKLVVWVAGRSGLQGADGRGHIARVGVRIENPNIYWCPGLIYELRSAAQGPFDEPLSIAVHDSDCAPGEVWESPMARPYSLPQGDWRISVKFCSGGVKENKPGERGAVCNKGPSQTETVSVMVQ